LELVTPGSGYVIGDTFTFTAADLGGGTVDCVIEVDSLNTGEIESVDVTDAGLGYTSTPTIVFDDPISGTTATGTVVMAKCTEFDYVLCNSNASLGIEMELGQQALVCDPTPSTLVPALETGYTIQATGCCYDCVEVQFDPDTTVKITYIDCTDGDIKETTIDKPTTLCVVNQSWWFTPANVDVTITVVGDCNLA